MDVLTAKPNYVYKPLDSANAEIRLLKVVFDVKQVLGRVNVDPLIGSLKHYYLPISTLSRMQRMVRSAQLPAFKALSYIWRDQARTHEITIDNKRLSITENLYKALRDVQRDAVGDTYIWADAICICQDDLAERSAQILLIREIYYSAAFVNIWLGSPTEEGLKCFKFIADLTGRIGPDIEVTEDSRFEEYLMKGVLIPTSAVVRAGIGFGQTLFEIGDIIDPSTRDDMAEMIDPDTNLSLHHDTIQKLINWSPNPRNLKRVQDRDFVEIANLIDQTLIQNCHWFEQMWVVQEVACSSSLIILFAGSSVFWKDFLHAIYYLHHHLSAPVSSIEKVTGLENIRQGWINGKRQPLRDLLRECRYRRATDPRDKIFSLLGMMGDKLSTYLIPDYSKSVSEVYANVAFHFIEQSESLDPICGWQTLDRQEQLPSWTPDYNLNQDTASSPLVPTDGRKSIFCASGSDYRSKYIRLDTPKKKDDFWRSLHTYGVYIDSVAVLSDPLPEDEPFGSIEHFWQSTLSASGLLLEGFTQNVQSHLENISSVVSKYSEYWNSIDHTSKYLRSQGGMSKHLQITDYLPKYSQSIENLSRTSNLSNNSSHYFDSIKPDSFIHEIYILDAYIQSLFCGRISTRERLTKEEINKFMSPNPPKDTTDPVCESFLTKACNALEAGMIGRSIAVTRNGYIGAIPQDAQTGDLICVLFGCSVPVVIRKRAGEEYQFIGECYLHGFMDAEAIAMQAKGNLQVQDFVLC